MIPKKMLDALAAKYGGKTQQALAMAEAVAVMRAAALAANIDFNDVCDIAECAGVMAKVKKLRPAPLLEAAGFCEADAWAR